MSYPKWVNRKPQVYRKRMKYEYDLLKSNFPNLSMIINGGELFIEGNLYTRLNNKYFIRVFYPDEYPFKPPISVVFDKVLKQSKPPHNYGEYRGGIRLCVINPNDKGGQSWQPNLTAISILEYSIVWLHAFEVWRFCGQWPLPEAD